jgi:tetratricopeptide (TPR) repeat protein
MARMQEARENSSARRTPRPAAPLPPRPAVSSAQQKILHEYQSALELMQQTKFARARTMLERLISDAPPEILERVRIYLSICERNVQESQLEFGSSEEQYDYAVSLLNQGNFEEARDQFESILNSTPEADFAHYGMALLSSMTGQSEEALEHLTRAIQMNPAIRIQARSDPDFVDMADDPRFTELLYPEMG